MVGGQPIPQGYYPNQPAPARHGILPQLRQQAGGTAKATARQTAGAVGRARMQADDEPASSKAARRELPPLKMPSPEQVGLGGNVRDVDWSAVQHRMKALAVSSFHLQKLEGGYRFTCVVPAGTERRKLEADGLTEAEAIDLALSRAESSR